MIATTPAVRPSSKPPRNQRRPPNRRFKSFSDADIAYVRAHYAADGPTVIAEHLGRAKTSIYTLAKSLGIARGKRPVTDADLEYVRRHWGTMRTCDIALALDRHATTVLDIARHLGLAGPSAGRSRQSGVYDADRDARLEELDAEIRRLYRAAGVKATMIDGNPVPLKRLAARLARQSAWRPPSALIAGDLDLEVYFEPQQPTPTRTQPGTPERVAVYAARVAAGEEIWCEGDAR